MSAGQTSLFMHELLADLPAGGRVLDLGCGTGSFSYDRYPQLEIAALDLERPAAADGWPAHVRFHQGAAEALPFPDGSFDLVIASFVLEHTSDVTRVLAEADRVLKPGGNLHLSTPNPKSFEDNLYRALFAGGGHRQQLSLEDLLRVVYRHTSLKLAAFADWPAGFTFFQDREALRQFTLAVVDALRRSGAPDVTLRSNYIAAFSKIGGAGYRVVSRVCTYCGSGHFDDVGEGSNAGWVCHACGHVALLHLVRLCDLPRLEAEARSFPARVPRLLVRLARTLLGLRSPRPSRDSPPSASAPSSQDTGHG